MDMQRLRQLAGLPALTESADGVRSPTKAEHDYAEKYCKEKGQKLGSIGVDKKTGKINIETESGKEYVLDALRESTSGSRSPTKAEHDYAEKYCKEKGQKLGSIGVDVKTGKINIETESGKEYVLDALK